MFVLSDAGMGKTSLLSMIKFMHLTRIVKDIRKHFDSIDHDAMMEQLARGFKDRELLDLFAKLLLTYIYRSRSMKPSAEPVC